MNIQEFTADLTQACEYYGKPSNKLVMSAWWEFALKEGLTNEQFREGLKICIQRSQFMPTPQDLKNALFGTVEERAMIQLDLYRQEKYDDVDAVAKLAMQSLGGAWAFKQSQYPDRFRADFVKAYERYANEAQRQDIPRQALEQKTDDDLQRRLDNIKQRQAVGMTLDEQDLQLLEQHEGLAVAN